MNHCRYCEPDTPSQDCPHNTAMVAARKELTYGLTNYWESWLHRIPITDPKDNR